VVPFAVRFLAGHVVSFILLMSRVPCYQRSVLSVSPSGSIRFPFVAVATTAFAAFSALTTCDRLRFQLVANSSSQDGYPTRFFASFNSYFGFQRQSSRSLGHSTKYEPILQSATPNGNTKFDES